MRTLPHSPILHAKLYMLEVPEDSQHLPALIHVSLGYNTPVHIFSSPVGLRNLLVNCTFIY